MNLVSVKSVSEIKLSGVKIALTLEDKSIVSMNIMDAAGNLVVVKSIGAYGNGIKVLIPAPPEKATRWVVTGKLLGLTQIDEAFEDHHDALERMRSYRNETGKYDDASLGLTIEEREVEIDPAQKPAADLVEIPF